MRKRKRKKRRRKRRWVGLGRVVREVRLHPEDHRFESQWWQRINFPF
jgi:hypothetical protein